LDNIRLAMNGRPLVRAGRDIDLKLLRRAAPGQPILVRDVDTDIKWDRAPDVTSSAYAEQDRLNLDFDEIMGAFSPGSIQSNRAMNETVGGMQLLAGGANAIGEYDLRVFTETWVEPVLRQLIKLEQAYETDETVLALAAKASKAYQRLGQDPDMDEVLQQELTTTVNVGIAATDPMQRIQKFAAAGKIVGEILANPVALQKVNLREVVKEVFGAAGYKDGLRFFNIEEEENPALQQLQQENQALKQEIETGQAQIQAKLQADLAKIKADSEAKSETLRMDFEKFKAEMALKREDQTFDHQLRMREASVRESEVAAKNGGSIPRRQISGLKLERDESGKIVGGTVEIMPPKIAGSKGQRQPERRRISLVRDNGRVSGASFQDAG
jgi:hypothetical protein